MGDFKVGDRVRVTCLTKHSPQFDRELGTVKELQGLEDRHLIVDFDNPECGSGMGIHRKSHSVIPEVGGSELTATASTPEDLDLLPSGSVIRGYDREGQIFRVYEKRNGRWDETGFEDDVSAATAFVGVETFTVLFRGEA